MTAILRCGAVLVLWLSLADQGQAQQQTQCPGASVPLDISFASKPFVRMRLGDREGNFLIDTGATQSNVDAGLFGVAVGSQVKIAGSSLPTLEGGVFTAVDLAQQQQFAPPGGRAGSIGTDILGSRTVEFHYEAVQPYLVLSKQRCVPRRFEDAGFVAVLQQGFHAADTAWFWTRMRHANQVNLPVIYIQLGTVKAPLWLDSGWGYGTSKHLIVFVNTALFEQLREAGIAMKRAGSAITSDCQGNRSEDDLWQVDTVPLVFTTQDGQPLFEYAAPTLQVRGKSPCGTIGNRPEPVGTVGALFLPRWGTVVFDGLNERVWVPRANDVVSPHDAYRSIALAQNESGGWTVAIRDGLDNAKADSLRLCNEKQGNCRIEATIGPSQFRCLAIAKSQQNGGVPSQATGGSLSIAHSAALENCATLNGAACGLVYSGCND
jgi:hypothetical protein